MSASRKRRLNQEAPPFFTRKPNIGFVLPIPVSDYELKGYLISLQDLYWNSSTNLSYEIALEFLGREDLLKRAIMFKVFLVVDRDGDRYLHNEDLSIQFSFVRGFRRESTNYNKIVKDGDYYSDLMNNPYRKNLKEKCIEIAEERGFDISEECVKEWFNKFMGNKKGEKNWPYVFKDAMDDLKDLMNR